MRSYFSAHTRNRRIDTQIIDLLQWAQIDP